MIKEEIRKIIQRNKDLEKKNKELLETVLKLEKQVKENSDQPNSNEKEEQINPYDIQLELPSFRFTEKEKKALFFNQLSLNGEELRTKGTQTIFNANPKKESILNLIPKLKNSVTYMFYIKSARAIKYNEINQRDFPQSLLTKPFKYNIRIVGKAGDKTLKNEELWLRLVCHDTDIEPKKKSSDRPVTVHEVMNDRYFHSMFAVFIFKNLNFNFKLFINQN